MTRQVLLSHKLKPQDRPNSMLCNAAFAMHHKSTHIFSVLKCHTFIDLIRELLNVSMDVALIMRHAPLIGIFQNPLTRVGVNLGVNILEVVKVSGNGPSQHHLSM